MRFDTRQPLTAAELVWRTPEPELARIIYEYGEEPAARRIARRVVEARGRAPIETTRQLADLVASAIPPHRRSHRIHPATRTFQALRIAVNDELGSIEAALPKGAELLAPGGRFGVIAFHSLEDRLVKSAFRQLSQIRLAGAHAEAAAPGRRRSPLQPPSPERAVPGARARLCIMTRLIQDQSTAVVRERDRRRLRAMAGMLCLGCVLVGGRPRLRVAAGAAGAGLVRRSRRCGAPAPASRSRTGSSSSSWPPSARSRGWTRPRGGWGSTPPEPDQIRLAREYQVPDGSGRSVSLRAAGDTREKTGRP